MSQRLGGAPLQALATKLAATFQVSMVPWGAVAAELGQVADGAGGAVVSPAALEPGRGFCFLPLPGSNGLPCHVNGFFEL